MNKLDDFVFSLFEIVLYYLIDWLLTSTCHRWVRVYFEVTNLLFSEACIWLTALKFFSADPFVDVNDGCPLDPESDVIYKIVSVPIVIGWSIFVFILTSLNTIIHFIVVFHCCHKVSLVKPIQIIRPITNKFLYRFFFTESR